MPSEDTVSKVDESGDEKTGSRESEEMHIKNRQFWDQFINTMVFNHAEQEKPRHGGRNWVKIPFYSAVERIQCFRAKAEKYICVFMYFNGVGGLEAYEKIMDKWSEFESSLPGLEHSIASHGFPEIFIKHSVDITDESTVEEQLTWLRETSNKFVDIFGPVFEAIERDERRDKKI